MINNENISYFSDNNDELFLRDETNSSSGGIFTTNSAKLPLETIEIKFQAILQNYEKQNFAETTILIDEMLILAPEHLKTLQLQSRLNQKFQHAQLLYDEIKQELEKERICLKQLLMLFKQAVNIYPNHPSGIMIPDKLFNLSKLYRKSMEQGAKALQIEKWQEAILFFEQAYKIEPGSGVLKIKIKYLKKIRQMQFEIDHNITIGDFHKARRIAYLADLTITEMKK